MLDRQLTAAHDLCQPLDGDPRLSTRKHHILAAVCAPSLNGLLRDDYLVGGDSAKNSIAACKVSGVCSLASMNQA